MLDPGAGWPRTRGSTPERSPGWTRIVASPSSRTALPERGWRPSAWSGTARKGRRPQPLGNDSYLEALPDRDGDRGPTVQVEAVLRHRRHQSPSMSLAGASQLAVGDDYVPSRPVDVHPDGASGGHDAATFRVVSYPERQAPPQLFAQPGLTDVQQRCSSVAVGGKIERLIIRHADIFARPEVT